MNHAIILTINENDLLNYQVLKGHILYASKQYNKALVIFN